jgi:Protein of unknown function (DUF1353)
MQEANVLQVVSTPQAIKPVIFPDDTLMQPLAVMIDHSEKRYFAKLIHPFSMQINKEEIIIAPINFQTDFTSFPSLARIRYHPMGRWAKAAVIHDYLYAGGWIRNYSDKSKKRRPDKKESDKIFYLGMMRLGVSENDAKLMYNALKLSREGYWRNKSLDLFESEV